MRSTFRQRLMTSTLLFGALGVATPAWAQPADEDTQENAAQVNQDEDDGEGSQSITVTGSRIQRRDLTSTSPLAVVQDEEFKLSGTVNVEQVINTLPQVIPGATAFSNNPGGGVATLNLRGLGASRTLVLVNGRRYVSFDPSQVVDLNTIPAFLLDSVDVVTGGASAVYGSDALAGVVNFRLKQNLNGIEAGTQYNITEEGDGARFNAHVAIGADFADGRGNVTAFGEYFKRQPVFQGDRDFSTFALADNAAGTALTPGGSSITNRGRFAIPATQVVAAGNGLPQVTLPRGAGNFASSAFGANFAIPGVSDPYDNPAESFNYAPDNYIQVPQERFLIGGYGSYEISDAVTAFAEVTFANNRVANELAPTPIGQTINLNLAAAQPFLSAADFAALQQVDANETAINAARAARGLAPLFGVVAPGTLNAQNPGIVQINTFRRITETGSRNALDERNAFRVVAGVKGPAFGDFTYEAYYLYARTRNAQVQAGNISRSAYTRAVESGAINIFGPNTLSQADVDSVSILAQNGEISTLQVASASIAGSPFNLGFGADNVGIALGAEYRSVGARFIPDTALSSGDVVGFNAGDPTEGSYNVKEAFAELRIPIFEDRPFFHRLEFNGAFRYSDYSLEAVGGVETYAAGFEWAPVPDLTFRGQYQRAVRAPNVGELFTGQFNNFPAASDPCSDRQPVALRTETVRQLCVATGVPAPLVFTSGIQTNAQIETLGGGNPFLGEETSDTYTAGVVIRPSFIPRLNITVDYFNIKVDDFVSSLGGGLAGTLNLCYNVVQDINSIYCQAIVQGADGPGGLPGRDPANGQIGGQFLPLISGANVAALETQGVDVQLDYSIPLGFSLIGGESSKFNIFFLGTYTWDNIFVPVVDQPDIRTDCAGRFGISQCGNPQSRFKWTSRFSLIDGPMTLSTRWRHLSAVRDDDDASNYVVERLGAKDYIDLSISYDLTDQFTFAAGVNNVFDIEPKQIGSNQEQANTYPSVYEVLGRDYFVSASFRF
jgi:outer membrane receptor protein involved in Fe transport